MCIIALKRVLMIRNYWNKNIPEWTDQLPPRDPTLKDRMGGTITSHKKWQKVTLGHNDYYGKAIGPLGKFERVTFKIIPIFLLSVAFAPVTAPLFFATGTYRKLGIWIREVRYSTSIKYIINVANNSLSGSASISAPDCLESNLNNDLIMPLLLSAKFTNPEEARRYLQTLSCVSKAFQPFVDQAAIRLINEGVITIAALPGIDNTKDKILTYLKSMGQEIRLLDLSFFDLTEEDLNTIVKRCPNIETLLIGNANLTELGGAEIANLNQLKSLSVRWVENFDKLQHLEDLEIKVLDRNLDDMVNLKKLTIFEHGNSFSLDSLINLEELNIRNCDLPSFDKCIKLKNLKIEDRRIQNIPSLDLLIHLEKLTLNCNNAAQLPSLANLNHLQELNLTNYNILQIPSLDHLIHLKKLKLNVECLMPDKIFDHLINLEELCVVNRQLQQFPRLKHLANLKKLTIHCLCLPTLPFFDALLNLNDLTISSNHLQNLPSLDSLNLEKFYVDCPCLTDIPLGGQTHLKELTIKAPKMQQFHSLEAFDQLEKLYLSAEVLAPSLDALGELKELTLKLPQIPSLDNLLHLEKLRIKGRIKNISLDTLKNLKELVLSDPGQLPALDALSSLEKLSLKGFFQNYRSLKNLNIRELRISSTSLGTLDIETLTHLKKLRIESCPHLKNLSSLDLLENLEKLMIFACPKLKKLPSLEKQKNLKRLHIENTGLKKEPNIDHLHYLEELILYI